MFNLILYLFFYLLICLFWFYLPILFIYVFALKIIYFIYLFIFEIKKKIYKAHSFGPKNYNPLFEKKTVRADSSNILDKIYQEKDSGDQLLKISSRVNLIKEKIHN